MKRQQPMQSMVIDKPLLGVWAVVTCLAGGAATQNAAGAAQPISQVDFKQGWEAGAPAHPALALAAIPQAAARQSTRIEQGPPAMRINAYPVLPRAVMPGPVDHIAMLAASTAPVDRIEPVAELAGSTMVNAPVAPVVAPALASLAEADARVEPGKLADTGLQTLGAPAPGASPAGLPGLVNRSEFKDFNLARVAGSRGPGTTELVPSKATPKALSGQTAKARSALKDRVLDESLIHVTGVTIGGQSAGTIDVRIGADMKPSVKVGDLLALVASQMDPDTYARLSVASGAEEYVNFATLRSAGFDVRYSAGTDSISIGTGN